MIIKTKLREQYLGEWKTVESGTANSDFLGPVGVLFALGVPHATNIDDTDCDWWTDKSPYTVVKVTVEDTDGDRWVFTRASE